MSEARIDPAHCGHFIEQMRITNRWSFEMVMGERDMRPPIDGFSEVVELTCMCGRVMQFSRVVPQKVGY